jgi:hypothetical protein
MQPHFAFQTEKSAELRKKEPELKVTEASAKAAAMWKEMDEKARKPFLDKHAEGMKLYEKQMAEREKKGFFTMPDGTKSTDPANKDKVKAPKKPSKGKDEADEEEEVLMPKKVSGAYTFFVKSFELEEGKEGKDRMALAGAAWKDLSDADKKPFEKMAEDDKKRRDAEMAHLQKHGWFKIEKCGCKSTECTHIKPKKKKSKGQKVADDDEEIAPPKKERKQVI